MSQRSKQQGANGEHWQQLQYLKHLPPQPNPPSGASRPSLRDPRTRVPVRRTLAILHPAISCGVPCGLYTCILHTPPPPPTQCLLHTMPF